MKSRLDIEQRYAIEREKFNEIAAQYVLDESAILTPTANFLDSAQHDSYLPGVAEFLGDLKGKQVLELGCGVGKASVLLAKSGAILSAFDISEKSVEVAKKRAELNGVADKIDFRVAVAEDLPFADESFDIVFGKTILHHIEVDKAGPEIYRVLKRGSRAAFSEPLANNKMVEFARDHLWYPKKAKEGADAPLTYNDLNAWAAVFDECEYREIHLLGMLERLTGWRWRFQSLHCFDKALTRKFPFLRRFCNFAVIFMKKAA